MEKWEDITIVNEDQLEAHSTFHYEDCLDLNGIWKYRCVLDPDKADDTFISPSFDLSSFHDIEVPGCVEPQGYSAPYYFGAGFPPAINRNKKKIPSIDHKKTYCSLYRRSFELKEKKEGQYVLRFDSVRSAFYCWLNGSYVGMSKSSMLPCEFDVSGYLKQGENVLAVKVFQFSDATYIEDQDMWFLSGIYRDVCLYHRNERHLKDVHLWSELTDDYRNAVFHADIRASSSGTVHVKIGGIETEADVIGGHAGVSMKMENVRLWSAERPELYDVEISYRSEDLTETQTFRFGFREDRVDHDKALYLHNGRPIKLRGINYHAFTPDKGYYVPEEVYRKDLKLLKEANINAIRTSHYPQADIFYDLCDELGFYVMDECNVESHGVREKNVPGDDPRWTKHVVDRMERMVLRDRDHACVSIWSLGNESACGENHFRMKEAALKLDTSRPIHYEGGRDLKLSDFLCDGYCSPERERKFANKEDVTDRPGIVQRLIPLLMSLNSITYEEYKNHPILVTEYQHAMGNTGRDIGEHIRIMDNCDQYCGGFVWDFKDKSLLKDGKLTYGGDWGVRDQGSHFCCNGICDPFSRPHSIYYEIQHAFQPVVIRKEAGNRIVIYNRNCFISTAEYASYFELCRNGVVIHKKAFHTDVAPRATKEYLLDLEVPEDDADYDLNIFFTKEGSSSYQQFSLKEKKETQKTFETKIDEEADRYILNDRYIIDRKTGDLCAILLEGKNILANSLRPSFYRPYTDGDLGFVGLAMKRQRRLDAFGKYSIRGLNDRSAFTVEKDRIRVTDKLKECTLIREYAVVDGDLLVRATLQTGHKNAPNRFGMQMEVDKAFHQMKWYGKGPEDHYPGKDEGGLIAIYSSDVLDQDDYVRPQEHGNKTHVRSARILSDEHVIEIRKEKEDLNVSFWPYTLKDLHEADHIFDLPEHRTTTVNIDCIQNGLSDCFVKCDPKYLIRTDQTYSYSFYINIRAINK